MVATCSIHGELSSVIGTGNLSIGSYIPGPHFTGSVLLLLTQSFPFLPKRPVWFIRYRVLVSEYDQLFPRQCPRWFIYAIVHALCVLFGAHTGHALRHRPVDW